MMDGRLQAGADVSRETLERLTIYHNLVLKWNPAINLVARSTLPQIWNRHILDSMQLWRFLPPQPRVWADLGTGGGFPGLVIAIVAAEKQPGLAVHLVESDLRKAAFLTTVLRETGVAAQVHPARAEDLPPLAADVVSARALAPLDALFPLALRHMADGAIAILPKGGRAQDELDKARQAWRFSAQQHPSLTDPAASVLVIEGLSRV